MGVWCVWGGVCLSFYLENHQDVCIAKHILWQILWHPLTWLQIGLVPPGSMEGGFLSCVGSVGTWGVKYLLHV